MGTPQRYHQVQPRKQRFRHRPDEGEYGDCHRTAIAAILGMPTEDVPHFFDRGQTGDDAYGEINRFLTDRGLASITIIYTGENWQQVAEAVHGMNPGWPALLSGTSANDVNHTVVIQQGEIVCDPSLDDSGIVGPCDDGFYWVVFIVAVPFQMEPHQ